MTISDRRIASTIAEDDGEFTIFPQPVRKFRSPPASKFRAANDNNPNRVTRMTPYNGGCSTLSGLVPITLPRVTMLEVAA